MFVELTNFSNTKVAVNVNKITRFTTFTNLQYISTLVFIEGRAEALEVKETYEEVLRLVRQPKIFVNPMSQVEFENLKTRCEAEMRDELRKKSQQAT